MIVEVPALGLVDQPSARPTLEAEPPPVLWTVRGDPESSPPLMLGAALFSVEQAMTHPSMPTGGLAERPEALMFELSKAMVVASTPCRKMTCMAFAETAASMVRVTVSEPLKAAMTVAHATMTLLAPPALLLSDADDCPAMLPIPPVPPLRPRLEKVGPAVPVLSQARATNMTSPTAACELPIHVAGVLTVVDEVLLLVEV